MPPPPLPLDWYLTRIERLERLLRAQRELTEQERRRADAFEASARTAWALGLGRGDRMSE